MENLLEAQIPLIVGLQQAWPGWESFFKFWTALGYEPFYLLLLPLIYWSVDRRVGIGLVIVFHFSAWLNFTAKVLADQPRPFDFSSQVQKLAPGGGGGLPSGHTQNTLAVWGYLAWKFQKRRLYVLAGLMIIMIPLSRIYLGVHFPTDLAGGYLLGALVLGLFLLLEPVVSARAARAGLPTRLAAALIVPGLMILFFPGESNEGLTIGASLMGGLGGLVFERAFIGFEAQGGFGKRVRRYAGGVVVLAGIYVGLKFAFADLEPDWLFRFIRYFLLGLWVSFGAPAVFVYTGAADRKSAP